MKRCAIVGTAASWAKTPWDDPTLEVWGLNDGYMCRDAQGRGLPRADRWFELHPIDRMFFRPKEQKIVYADQVPQGSYVRPDGHLEWLRDQAKTIPVYLQAEPPAGWPPNAQRFPIEAVEARFGTYWASGPSYMVALAILEGYDEIHVYGIHLSTEHEYREQRPQFEHLLGIAKGLGITVVMAEDSPVLKHGWKYGYEPKPASAGPHPAQVAHQQVHAARAKLLKALAAYPRWKNKGPALDRLRRLEALEMDYQIQWQHVQMNGTVTAQVIERAA